MIWVLVVLALIVLLLGGSGLRAVGRVVRGPWRPGAAVIALLTLMAAIFMALRAAWVQALVLAGVGAVAALGARRRPKLNSGARRPFGATSGARPRAAPAMTRAEAAAILGVEPDAEPAQVQAAYVRLMRLAHPDHGGTSGLARQLNAARETLNGRDVAQRG